MTGERQPMVNPYMRTDKGDYQTHARVYDQVWDQIVRGAEHRQFANDPIIRLAQAAAQYAYHMHVNEFDAAPTTEARSGIAAHTGSSMRKFVHEIADLAQDAINACDTSPWQRQNNTGESILTKLEGSRKAVSKENYFVIARDGYFSSQYVLVPLQLLPFGWSLSRVSRADILEAQDLFLKQAGFLSPAKSIEALDEVGPDQRYWGAPSMYDGSSGFYRYDPRWKAGESRYTPKTARFVECRHRLPSHLNSNVSLSLFRRGGKGTPYNFAYARIHHDGVLKLVEPFLSPQTGKLRADQLPGPQPE